MSDILIPQILNGLTIGAILVLIATGLTLIFGLMGVVNFSHGAMYMLGAYIAMQVLSTTGHYGLALLASLIGVALLGFLLEYFMIRRLYGRDPLLQVLLTFGVAIVIRESVEIVWGPRIQVFLPPTSFSGSAVLWGAIPGIPARGLGAFNRHSRQHLVDLTLHGYRVDSTRRFERPQHGGGLRNQCSACFHQRLCDGCHVGRSCRNAGRAIAKCLSRHGQRRYFVCICGCDSWRLG